MFLGAGEVDGGAGNRRAFSQFSESHALRGFGVVLEEECEGAFPEFWDPKFEGDGFLKGEVTGGAGDVDVGIGFRRGSGVKADLFGFGECASDNGFPRGQEHLLDEARVFGLEGLIDVLGVLGAHPGADGLFVLEARLVAGWGGMGGGPDGALGLCEEDELAFLNGFWECELEVSVQEVVEGGSGGEVVVVWELGGEVGEESVGGTEKGVEVFEVRQALGVDFLGPIVGGGNAERARGGEGGDVDVALVDAQVVGVFAGASALHGGGDHDAGEGGFDARIDAGDHHGLGASAAGTGAGDALGVDFLKGEQEVEGAHAVPSLEAEGGLEAEVGLGADESLGLSAVAMFGELHGVGIAERVVQEGRAAHARELDAAGLEGGACGALEFFGTGIEFLFDALGFGFEVHEAALWPVAVGAQNAWDFSLCLFGSVEAAGDEMPGEAFKEDAVDGVVVAFDAAMDDGVERGFVGEWPEAGGEEQALFDFGAAFLPCFWGGHRGEGKVAVEVAQGAWSFGGSGEGEQSAEQGRKPGAEGVHGGGGFSGENPGSD